MLRLTYYSGLVALFGAGSFLIIVSGAQAPLVVLWGAIVGAICLWLTRIIDQQSDGPSDIAPLLVAGTSVLLPWCVAILARPSGSVWGPAVAVVVAVGAAWLIDAMTTKSGPRVCFICKEPAKPPAFTCPRCQQTICTKPACWIGRRFRCKNCDEREVIVFPIEEKWWQPRLGARVRSGSCCHCYKESGEADLRACGQCRWTQCKRCWDYLNGQCSHCEWWMPDLPKALQAFVGASAGQADQDPRAQRRQR